MALRRARVVLVTPQPVGARSEKTAPAPVARGPVRLLTLSTLFPNARRPRHGIFIANRLRRLCDTGRVDATVIAALPRFPGVYGEHTEVPREEEVAGFRVRHPRYFHVPMLGMRLQPRALARALLAEVERCGLSHESFDVVDAHYLYPDGVAGAAVAEALRLPLVLSARGSDVNLIAGIPFARRRIVAAARRAEAVIAVSAALAARMAELGIDERRIHVLRNGVDTAVFALFPRADARRRLGFDERAPLVLAVGNLVPEKGFDLLLRTIARMPDVRLVIVGEGPLRASLQALAERMAPGRVTFRADVTQPELRFHYAAADVLALPSLREGWPNVVLEAIACGTPVVASAVGGIPEMLSPPAPGRVVAERSEDAWREALQNVLAGRYDVEDVRRHALAFGWDDVVERQCALYEAVAAGLNQWGCENSG
jgi:glycosyltransferase involved in cell wall biosynthesis